MNRWIVVADAGRARFFENPSRNALTEREDMVLPEARLHERDLTSDRPGRDSGRGGRHHAMDAATPAKEQDEVRFAKAIAEVLESARLEGVEEFVLVAAPRMLGRLRAALSKQVSDRVAREIDSDLTTLGEREILDRLNAV